MKKPITIKNNVPIVTLNTSTITFDEVVKLDFLVDTGATHTFISPEMARKIGITKFTVKSIELTTATGSVKDKQKCAFIYIETKRLEVFIINRPLIYGVLGMDFLSSCVVSNLHNELSWQ